MFTSNLFVPSNWSHKEIEEREGEKGEEEKEEEEEEEEEAAAAATEEEDR